MNIRFRSLSLVGSLFLLAACPSDVNSAIGETDGDDDTGSTGPTVPTSGDPTNGQSESNGTESGTDSTGTASGAGTDTDTDATTNAATDGSTGGTEGTGSTGSTGGTGDTDSTGSTGDTGDTGSTGSTGDTGSSGSSSTGPECVDANDCDNGIFCDGVEDCVGGLCAPGTPPDCGDALDCTVDGCDPVTDACVNAPDDQACPCGETCDPETGCGDYCVEATCEGQTYECGNCLDDDLDCMVDSKDPNCWGPCDNNEEGFDGEVPGQQNQSECLAMDCYFDSDSGSGNDECYWSHSCDPLAPAECIYDPNHNLPGTPNGCVDLDAAQLPTCGDVCGPLTPNGCDCFGCCDVTVDEDTAVTVYLGSQDAEGNGTCSIDVVEDPALCHPCTQVNSCLNTCETCELCLGKTELPPECDQQECEGGAQPCGLPDQDPCMQGFTCITGCCTPVPM